MAEVVAGVDGTATALRAVAWAATEARMRRLPLRIVHAAPYATGPAGVSRAAAILARAHTVARQREPHVDVGTERVDDHPVPALVRASEDAELLVVGMASGGTGGVRYGSVALAVSCEARCPVSVVRGHHRSPSTTHPVMLGIDDLPAGAGAAAVAFADAERHGTRLVAVHVRNDMLTERDLRGAPDDEIAQLLVERLGPWRSIHPGVPVDVMILRGSPADELVRAASAARLLVVTAGATARTLVRFSPCPITVAGQLPSRAPSPTGAYGGGA
jgi:nucleotide-binding universal stress UspA family protein